MRPNPKALRFAAQMLMDMSNDGAKAVAMALAAPAVLLAMRDVPQGEQPTVENLQAVLRSAAAGLARAAGSM